MSESVILRVLIEQQEINLLNPMLSIQKKTGEHTNVLLRGILDPQFINQEPQIVSGMDIQILKKSTDEILFHGITVSVDLSVETVIADPMRELELKAMSYTCLLDRKRRKRSFQKNSMSYKEAAEILLKEYMESGIIICPQGESAQLGKLVVQYQETDWTFLKRLASQLNLPIIPSHNTKGPRLFMGVMQGGATHTITSQEEERISEICCVGQDGISHQMFSWVSEDPKLENLDIGDVIQYKTVQYYIKEAEIQVKNSAVYQKYWFVLQNGFLVSRIQNPYITGLSLPGNVTKVSGNQVQISLDIDVAGGSECWYTYSTFYSTFYCMPEKGDRIHLYMPSSCEEQAFVLNSIRDKPVTDNTQGKEQFENDTSGNASGTKEEIKAENKVQAETDITSWLSQIINIPHGQIIGMGIKTAEISDSDSGNNTMVGTDNGKSGGNSSAISTSAASPAPSFDFQTLEGNEGVKVLATKGGKMIVLDDNQGSVSITDGNGTYVSLNKAGIQIHSEGELSLNASGNININAEGTLHIQADEKVTLGCKASQFELTPDHILISGTDIKMNE